MPFNIHPLEEDIKFLLDIWYWRTGARLKPIEITIAFLNRVPACPKSYP
jgi:hypothetical protein